ncbi:uncharacterized protein LOC123546141 isoform X3 [Mercenaria mercenaria]|uniref:uncharacterized protein LOC123546141 isoform X3 n=1 Tax=Mercenaria mercenaria TaxID=6596 RepID=UPI00234F01D0|nr:uncharacterized protein LOC123546141 isoform X3 [Mercenaria mercenaria]
MTMNKQNIEKKSKKNVSMKNGPKLSLAEDQQNGTDNNQEYLEFDPDLSKDVEIFLTKDNRAVSRATMSAKSRKTIQSGRLSESRENIVRSRGRPIKPHETEPFLSIDNLPPEKSFVSEKSTLTDNTVHSRAPKPTQQSTDESRSLEAQLHRMSAYMSPYHQQTPAPPSPSVVTGHIYTKNAQAPKGRRTSPRKSSGSRPGSQSAQVPVQNEPENISPVDISKPVTPTINVTNSGNLSGEKNSLNGSNPDVSETKKSKLSRPSSAPAVRKTLDVSVKKSRPGSEKSRLMSRSNTGSARSRVSSAGSRSGTASRAVHNVFGIRSMQSRTGRITPANTPYHSPNKHLRPPNHHVKTPFKHTVNQPEFGLDGRQTPSMGMKERTALAAFHVHKMLSVAGEKDVHKVSGKLQKGKLKPLYPVNVEGPKIDKCRGIVSETRSYQPSPSRTLQRRVNLINKIPNVHEYLYERPRTVESVHQTSVASSIDEFFNMEGPDSNRSLPDEILYSQEKSILEPKTPENTFLPEPTQDEITDGFQTKADVTPRMFATEVGTRDEQAVTVSDVTVPSKVQHELHLSDSGATLQETDDILPADRNNSNTVDTDKNDTNGPSGSVEERARIGSPSKSVRFAEQRDKLVESQSSKEIKQMENMNIARGLNTVNDEDIDDNVIETVSRKNKQNSKGSCKSENSEIAVKKDDDEDDEGNSKDDNRKNNDNIRRVNSGGNVNHTKDSSDNKENISGNNNESGQKRPVSGSQTRSESTLGNSQRSRSKGESIKSSASNSQVRKTGPSVPGNTKSVSKGGHCSKFEQSKASRAHTHTLEVSSVLHGHSVTTVVGPESPKRGRSRSASPNRGRDQTFQFFSQKSRPCFEDLDDFSSLYGNSQRSRVKFMLEGEEPEVETIFMENEDDVKVKPDKEVTYDVLDTEIEMLRSAIQNSLISNNEIQEEVEIECKNVSEEEAESAEESESETVVFETDTVDTLRGEYSNILEKYRQRCMDRSESFGAISTTLVTPRQTQSLTSSRSRSLGNETHENLPVNRSSPFKEKQLKILDDTQPLNTTMLSDSGHGSVDNLSDLSLSTSQARSDVPKLDLGGSTSDLGLGSGRSDTTVTTGNGDENDKKHKEEKTLLELVCDQLSPIEQRQKPAKRREIIRQIMLKHRQQREEDVSELKVVATTKSLSKNSKMKNSDSSGIQAPFPPVCFKINARPPKGYLYYFAYGPDMNPNRFSSYIQRNVQDRYWGLLFGFNLVFNKRGTSEEAGGFSNLEFNPLRSVEGCIYKITPQELQVLDKCVGYPQHYEHLVLPVWLSNSFDPDSHGVAQYCVPALTYIAQNRWTETEKPLNCDYALSQCIKSADIVTTAYKDSLVAMATQQQVMASA